ncbi:LytTR family DNA-binding domain-containing protein [Paeniglutamicibacter sp. Y32M11]|uniref:LytR/AlgR family response regulator transcription factor n=1 Tax=Paeniglutamicibacter sp. Y32M11 TaxID=2853258 RepID=UPI00104D9880|nr:LytTR family DNA-binding domain-containing protein [Paeniglutamicibacter sp. Y32M11]QXQ11225.1 LytTR family DNA-binding domain-containing protein [Paeniglutamicibacter sp. Y32M11]
MINVVVADDELPAVAELAHLLSLDARVGSIHRANSGAEALKALEEFEIDALFLDIHMPALSGLDIARVISRFTRPPAVVFVTADEDQALEAFELAALDYVLKPVRPERLAESIRRICELTEEDSTKPEMITVEKGGITKLIRRDEVHYVQAQGDYARLHTQDSSYLIRVPLNDLEQQWGPAGYIRIHRSYLVAMDSISTVKLATGKASVLINGTELPVSRRALPYLRERMAANRVRPL